jgi:hypothetical protein
MLAIQVTIIVASEIVVFLLAQVPQSLHKSLMVGNKERLCVQ